MNIIRPRLNDFFNITFTQEEVNFAIPLLDEDIPLYLDPFLLWNSPSQQDNALHTGLINSFNNIGNMLQNGKEEQAIELLQQISECNEVGLGTSKTKKGNKISEKTAKEIINLFKTIPQINKSGFSHFEEIQLYVNNISKDRVSDIACNFLKSFLIDFTVDACNKNNIPLKQFENIPVYSYKQNKLITETVQLPYNPKNNTPIIFVPKRWLRFTPWINYEDYFKNCCAMIEKDTDKKEKIDVLNYNRNNYNMVQIYISNKERKIEDCKNDPLFKQIPIISAKRALSTILALPTGKTDNADKKFEDNVAKLLTSLLYPHLDFAAEQCRTVTGVNIRDLIFYNNKSIDFLKEIYEIYECRQIVFEMKNVLEVSNDNIDQLNRYLTSQFGKFGIIVTRNELKSKVQKNIIDLWSGQRKCIIVLTDQDLEMMAEVYESKQRDPIEVLKKKYVEFIRMCPS